MAQSWYLMKSPHDQVSGFEDEALSEFGQEGIAEILESGLAMDVELCNYNLSIRKQIRAVIENTVQDTKLKTLTRHMIVPIGTCKAGMYVYYKNRYWLIVGIVDDNMVYEKAILSICNYRMEWINESGQIITRWANVVSASQYNNGETANNNYTVRSDQLLVAMPDDDESILLNSNSRFIIDRRCKIYERSFDEAVTVDTSKPVIVYRVTRSDSVLYDYGDSGHSEFMLYQTEKHYNDGYYVVDGQGYWLCDIPIQEHEPTALTCEIHSDSDEIYADLEPVEFIGVFFDADGNETAAENIQWQIDSEFLESLDVDYVDNSILVSTTDDSIINKSFTITLSANGYEPVSKQVFIREFL